MCQHTNYNNTTNKSKYLQWLELFQLRDIRTTNQNVLEYGKTLHKDYTGKIWGKKKKKRRKNKNQQQK